MGVVIAYFALQLLILPKLGVQTWMNVTSSSGGGCEDSQCETPDKSPIVEEANDESEPISQAVE